MFKLEEDDGTTNTSNTIQHAAKVAVFDASRTRVPTPEALCNRDANLSVMIESAVSDAHIKKLEPSLEYLLLANVKWDGGSPGIRRRQLFEAKASTSVSFSGGVTSFVNDPTNDIDKMIRDAIETTLASNLTRLLIRNRGRWERFWAQFSELYWFWSYV